MDEFGGRGYVPFYTEDLEKGKWSQVPPSQVKMPNKPPRHGTVLPLKASEYEKLKANNN